MKRVAALADTHCGHLVGLTHPDCDIRPPNYDAHLMELARARRRYWNWFESEIRELQPVDILLFLGDAIDGKGEKSGGTELITKNRQAQVDMAVAALRTVKAKKICMVYGTPYHTGVNEDWEDDVAKGVKAEKIGGEDTANVNGLLIDYKHHISASGTPLGRETPLERENVWNLKWAETGLYPRANVILRAHVHYHVFAGDARQLLMTLPALQGLGSKYGARHCSGIVDFGFVHFDVENDGSYQWHVHIARPRPHLALSL